MEENKSGIRTDRLPCPCLSGSHELDIRDVCVFSDCVKVRYSDPIMGASCEVCMMMLEVMVISEAR